jgi:hypothetical protein
VTDNPSNLGNYVTADIRELVTPRFGHRDVVPRTSDRHLSTRSTKFSLRSSRPRGVR